ncbi:cobyric acid synthase [Lentilactobacillus kosonis]|uniref:Cobyric acid synthase n=1 Tax=Lentilactobacillus kosonis TaxID=2810561 RepID=A0A401FMP0_9LACO|nr:cobyric acid synthase [Lentilactobacillus kosonis]
MAFLRDSGLDQAIINAHNNGSLVIGICGGYQILGEQLSDPEHVESALSEQHGLGLLSASTVFTDTKTTTQAVAKVDDQTLKGYEIHMGKTVLFGTTKPFSTIISTNGKAEDRPDGGVNDDQTVFGTYLHGIFDNSVWTRKLLNDIRSSKGLAPLPNEEESFLQYKEEQYEKLADVFEENVDMDRISEILKQSGE